jgi:hypothetical protein
MPLIPAWQLSDLTGFGFLPADVNRAFINSILVTLLDCVGGPIRSQFQPILTAGEFDRGSWQTLQGTRVFF